MFLLLNILWVILDWSLFLSSPNKDNTNFPETNLDADKITYSIAIDGNGKLWIGKRIGILLPSSG